jgi:MFS transporter, FSR family, fosmidomycin resistance protein
LLADWRTALFAAALIPATVLLLLVWYRNLLRVDEVKASVASTDRQEAGNSGNFDFMRLPSVWMCFIFFFITAMALGGIQSFSAPGLREIYGMSLATASVGFTAYMLASAAGMIWGGFIAARAIRHDRTIAIAFALAGCMALLIASGLVPAWMAIVLMGAIGFGAGVAGPSRDLLIRGAAPKNATGRVYGVVYSGLDIGLAGSPLLFGALMDANQPASVFIGIGLFQIMAIVTAVGVGSNTARKAARAGVA